MVKTQNTKNLKLKELSTLSREKEKITLKDVTMEMHCQLLWQENHE